jgi:purine nucleosidase
MNPRQLLIDCDPGIDDAIALLLAFASPAELHLLGITTVAGNVGPVLTARNARIVRELAGREDVPVHAGCDRPLVRDAVDAGHFHGASGLGNVDVFEPRAPLAPMHGVNFIVDTLRQHAAGSVSIAITGPMTNIAMAMRLAPDIVPRIHELIVMGGARSAGGNITASAEYNIFADPHAAAIVLRSGCPVVMCGLDVTYQVRAGLDRVAAIRALGGRVAEFAAQLLDFANHLTPNAAQGIATALHDPCTIAWLLQPQLFVGRPAAVEVETSSQLTLGATAVEFRAGHGRPFHVQWLTGADDAGVFALLNERLARFR